MSDKNALIVEDTLNWKKRHQVALQELGFGTVVANTYAEAVGLLRHERFDIAVIDLCLTTQTEPENLDGVFLLPYFVEQDIPVIIVTGRGVRPLIDVIYRDFDVFEILDKLHFDPQKFKDYVLQAVARHQKRGGDVSPRKPALDDKLEELILEILRSGPAPIKKTPVRPKTPASERTKPPRLFISYSTSDKNFADRLAHDLKIAGFDIWYDSDDIHVGDNILEKIEQGLSECDNMIIILSPPALQSWMVRQELVYFRNEERRRGRNVVLPVLYKDCDIPRWL
jgi:hypothetical protein